MIMQLIFLVTMSPHPHLLLIFLTFPILPSLLMLASFQFFFFKHYCDYWMKIYIYIYIYVYCIPSNEICNWRQIIVPFFPFKFLEVKGSLNNKRMGCMCVNLRYRFHVVILLYNSKGFFFFSNYYFDNSNDNINGV